MIASRKYVKRPDRLAMTGFCGPILIMGLLLTVSARANDPFFVAGVKIDATAKSAPDAQGKAQNEGFRLAYKALLDRLVPRDRHVGLPQPSDEQLSGMIQSFQVGDEKRSSTRYLATLTVQFKPDQARYWFRNAGVSISETVGERTLLVPVWTPAGEEPQLWGGLNPWRQAFENREENPGDNIPFFLADGDLPDLQGLTARQALSHDEVAVTELAARYDADRYAIVAIRMTGTETIIAYWVKDPFGARRWNDRFPRENGADQTQELAHLADAVLIALNEDWKKRTLISAGTNASMAVTVPIASLKGWRDIKVRLEATAGVRDIIVREMTLDEVLIHLSYQGELSQLQVGLKAQSLQLAADDGGRARLLDLKTQGRGTAR